MTLFDFSQSIRALNREKKHSDSLKFFKENKTNFTADQIGANTFIVNDIISALIETNHYDKIFIFIEQFNIILDPKNFYFLLKKFKDKPSVNWQFVNKFCDLIQPDNLSTECSVIDVTRKGVAQQMELASAREDWFSYKTKALFELEKYEECLDLSKLALESFEKFHYSNDVWFARRIALSKINLGNIDEALNELLQVLKRKKEWYIQDEIAKIYKDKSDLDTAFKYAIDAITNYGDIEYKVGLLVLIGDILYSKGDEELAFKHYLLSKLLRIQQEWKIPNNLTLALNKFDFIQTGINTLPQLKIELNNFWTSLKPQKAELDRYNGKISKILHNDEKGVDGFIKYDINKSIYFRVNITEEIIKKLKVGLTVEFKIFPAKQDRKEKAIQLKVKEHGIN